ncbi:hypothetical protein [Roseivirga sp.]|uniref:hypothetical protein n=1 Tax=Roseivirga sp. TaxID=1964215 RepID=UPI002B27AA65|nr:hypothetical protein [Roseivirga sp.]
MKTKSIIASFIVLVFFSSCDRPDCQNTNSIFDLNGLETTVYKQELVKEMDRVGKENLTYWLSDYTEQNGQEFITVNIQGDGLCAKGLLQVNDWTNIEGIKKTKGVSYIGTELRGLIFDIFTSGESIDFIYKSTESIVD